MEQYGDEIIKMLIDDLDANTICKELGLCTGTSAVKAGTSTECEVCNTVIVTVKGLISQKSTKVSLGYCHTYEK